MYPGKTKKGKKKKKEAELSQDLHPRKGDEGKERLPALGESPHQQRNQLRQEKSFRCLEKSTTASL